MPNGHEVAMALRAAYLAMHRQANAILSPHGVTANQYVLLALLAEQDGVLQRDLVVRASSDPNTIRPMLDALERKGLLEREPHPEDGRAWRVRLSRKGRRMYEKLKAASQPFRDRLIAALDDGQSDQLVTLLEKVTTGLAPVEP